MAPRPLITKGGEGRMIRTTLELPEELWRRIKMRAIDEGGLKAVIVNSLEEYLAKPAKARKGGK